MTIRRTVEIASVALETQSLGLCLAANLITDPSRTGSQLFIYRQTVLQ